MNRSVQPEWLDQLPEDDPGAKASRRDLARLNRVMGNARAMRKLLGKWRQTRAPRRIVELGAGDGKFLLRLAQRLAPQWRDVEVVLVDRKNALAEEVGSALAALGWRLEFAIADVFDWLEKSCARSDILIANLFLHHFTAHELSRLLLLASERTDFFAAVEPRRSGLPWLFSCALGGIGCHRVTRHDAVVSVRAGFRGRELSELWPSKSAWHLSECNAGIFTHAYSAGRIETV